MPEMYDSYSSDKMANPEEQQERADTIRKGLVEDGKCWACGKIDCTCDEETMQAMDEEDRLMEEIERQEESDRLDG